MTSTYLLCIPWPRVASTRASVEQMEQEIRHRLVVGICDVQLSKRLQLDSALDLDKAKRLVRQTEAVQEQTRKLSAAGDSRENPVEVDGQSGRGSHPPSNHNPRRRHQPREQSKPKQSAQCTRCGKKPGHPRAECPATCHRCAKRGHFSSQCHGLRQFMGMINQLGKFSSRLADLTQPLRELLSSKNEWCWDKVQQEAFELAKKELSTPTMNYPSSIQPPVRHQDIS